MVVTAPGGTDSFGNRYYVDRRNKGKKRERRWVLYKGAPEASKVPPEWHAWLHSHVGQPPVQGSQPKPWQKPHRPNMTGTPEAYRPAGSILGTGHRPKATGDYKPWRPE